MPQRILSARERYELLAPWQRLAAPVAVAPSSGGIVSGPGEPLVGPRGPHPASVDPRDPMAKLPGGLGYDDMVDNLVSHYHGSNDDEKKQGRLWYRVAHNLFAQHAKDADVSHARAVAVGSATSPNTDWNENVKHAQNMLMHYRPDDSDHNEQDWQVAHIHPQARADFQAANGRDPTESDDDLNQLADLHAPHFARGKNLDAQNDLSNPEARANWMQNIQHHGMDNILADHEKQVFDNRGKKDKDGNIIGYTPAHAMRDTMRSDLGGTLGNNVRSAKNIIRSGVDDPDEFARILGGPKVRNFSSNILDDTPMDDEGYLAHPNGDWTQHGDLGGTIDAHHLRASTMAHGAWERKGYRPEGGTLNPSDPYTYDVFNRGLLDATHRVNSTISDPTKHLTPKQLQAIIWLKHKGDNERFKAMPINHQSEITPEIQQAHDLRMQKKQEAEERKRQRAMSAALEGQDFADMPPLWRKMFMTRIAPEWTDLLKAWVEHYSPGPGKDDGSEPGLDPADPRGREPPERDPHLGAYYPVDHLGSVQETLDYVDRLLGS